MYNKNIPLEDMKYENPVQRHINIQSDESEIRKYRI